MGNRRRVTVQSDRVGPQLFPALPSRKATGPISTLIAAVTTGAQEGNAGLTQLMEI